jgi:hypothetical protein
MCSADGSAGRIIDIIATQLSFQFGMGLAAAASAAPPRSSPSLGVIIIQQQQQQYDERGVESATPTPGSDVGVPGSPAIKRNQFDSNDWLQACTPPEQQCYSTGVTLHVSSFWMMASSSTTTLPTMTTMTLTPPRLELIMDVISCLTKVLSAANPTSTSVVQTKAKDSDVQILRLKCARSTALSLWTAGTGTGTGIGTSLEQQQQHQYALSNRHVSHEAVAMYKKNAQRYANHQGELGMAWLQCLVAWSGLFQSPWAYCSITEARRLVQQAMVFSLSLSEEYVDVDVDVHR